MVSVSVSSVGDCWQYE